jgi:DNA-binding transcriptional LysR family regulator
MEVFVAVAEAGGFAAAGARLRTPAPTVTRIVAALEDHLGTRLLNRTTRRMSLTEAGARYLERARRLLAEIADAEREVAGEAAAPAGHVTVTCPVPFGRMHVLPLVAEFLRAEPRVTASVLMINRVVNLVEEGIDCALRIGALPDSSLVARRVGETRRILVASPGYLARRGTPMRPEDLKAHDVIVHTHLMPDREWRHAADDGRPAAVALAPRLTVNDATAALAAAERDEGIAIALSYMVAPALAEGRLVPVLERFAPAPVPVQIVYPHARLLAPKIRAFVDFAAPWLRRRLARA